MFSDLTGEAEDTNGELIPDGYGTVIQVPAYPIAINSGTVTFRWGQSVTSITQVYVELSLCFFSFVFCVCCSLLLSSITFSYQGRSTGVVSGAHDKAAHSCD